MAYGWCNTSDNEAHKWTCGYCGNFVAGTAGYHRDNRSSEDKLIYICPHCQNPTVFILKDYDVVQVPSPISGNEVAYLPSSVGDLYDEARRCIQYSAYTSAVLSLRKLLMHIAVDKGAEEGKSFVSYVGYLQENGWLPPSGAEWADEIRKLGNEANHEIVMTSREEATMLLDFTEMLLNFSYEFPSRHRQIS